MKETEISQPEKAREEQRVMLVFKHGAFEPRVIEAEIVEAPEIMHNHSPGSQREINDARNQEDERRQGREYLDTPLGDGDKLIHAVNCAPYPKRGWTYQTASGTATPSRCSSCRAATVAILRLVAGNQPEWHRLFSPCTGAPCVQIAGGP